MRERDPFFDLMYRNDLLSPSEYLKLTEKIQRKLDLEILLTHLKKNIENGNIDSRYSQLIHDLEYLHSFYNKLF